MNIHSISTLVLTLFGGCMVCACDESDAQGGADSEDNTDGAPALVYLADIHNYTYESTLHIPIVETAASADIEICWNELNRDFQCHEMDPEADIDNVSVVRIRNMSEAQIEAALSRDGLQQSNVDGYLNRITNGSTSCATLSEFSFMGSAVAVDEEYLESDEQKYLLVLTTGTLPGVGARMMTFMTPTAGSTQTSVTLKEGCDLLDFGARLTSLTPVKVSADGGTALDWGDIATPGLTRVMLGFYENMTVVDLEAEVLDLMLIATKKWEHEIDSVAPIPLTEMVDEDGTPFEGFSGEGTWIFSVQCGQCRNPAPYLLTVLAPEGE